MIGNADETTVSKLNPKLVVVFGKKSDITELLKLNTNILIVSDEGEFYFYNATKPIEKSLDSIIDSIVEKLDHYADDIRGNEHARLIKAFERIGQELGYVPEREFSKKGIRLDEIWRDKEGNFRVAIEVETKGGWKKDLLLTSEVEPDLSIIVTYQKTDT